MCHIGRYIRRVACCCSLLIARFEMSARRGRYGCRTVSTICHIGRRRQSSDIMRTMTCENEPLELRRRASLGCVDRKHGHQMRSRSKCAAPCAERRVCDESCVPFWETGNRGIGVGWVVKVMSWKSRNRRNWTNEVEEQVQDE